MVEACEKDIALGLVTNLNERTIDLTSDVIAQVAFGEDWGDSDVNNNKSTLDCLRILLEEMGKTQKNRLRSFHPLYQWRVRKLQNKLDGDMEALILRRVQHVQQEQQQQQSSSSSPAAPTLERDVLSLSLKAAMGDTPGDKFQLTKDDTEGIVSQLKTFYFAGHDTTATAIAWAIWLLAQHPDRLERVRKELLTEVGAWAKTMTTRHSSSSSDHTPTFADWERCVYLKAVLQEVLRLYPPASTARFASDPDATYKGYHIGNSILWVNAYACQRHPDHWKDPDAFQPERFLEWKESDGLNRYHYMPFSRGPRDCIGKYFAMVEGKIAIATLVLKFDVTEVLHKDEVMAARLTNVPLHGCQVKLALRK